MEDISLDEFLDAGEDDPEADTDDPADVTPATPTYGWSPDGGVCSACGSTARRRWQSEAGLVCRECKEW
ncbi:MAG: hypothetical protein V5A39_12670 [Haloarculaceae archaeon]